MLNPNPTPPASFDLDLSLTRISTNPYANELSSNRIYNLFAAFKNNQIDYATFYGTRDNKEVFQNLRVLLKEKNAFINEDLSDITWEIKNPGNEKILNIALIVVESLSAEFLGVVGNRKDLTQNLDQLSKESLLFTRLYATGTRTDRGLESITLSIPPTPGRSMVKRPHHNENLFSWGLLMKSKGYDIKFIYGGYGYFDNMNYFFSHNGFEIIDRKNFSKNEITFENAWGVCDEGLYHKSMKEFDKSFEKKSPFLRSS